MFFNSQIFSLLQQHCGCFIVSLGWLCKTQIQRCPHVKWPFFDKFYTEEIGLRLSWFYCCFVLTITDGFVSSGGTDHAGTTQEPLLRMPIRRNLAASLAPQSPQSVARTQACEEDMFPLQCTPEPAQKTVQSSSSAMDPNMTFEVADNDDLTAANATIIISTGSPGQASKPTDVLGHSQSLQPPKATERNQMPTKRSETNSTYVITFLKHVTFKNNQRTSPATHRKFQCSCVRDVQSGLLTRPFKSGKSPKRYSKQDRD